MDPRLFEKLMPASGGPAVAVRQFTDQRLAGAIDRALAGLEATGASLDVDFDGEGVRGVIAARLDRHWSVALVGEVKKGRGPVGGARVVFRW